MASTDGTIKEIESLKLSEAELRQEKADITAQIKVKEQELEKVNAEMQKAFTEEELADLEGLKESLTNDAQSLLSKLNKE